MSVRQPRKNARKICAVESCFELHISHGYCAKHYARWKRYGDPNFVKSHKSPSFTVEERFWLKVNITSDPDQCWEWTRSTVTNGYGVFRVNHRNYYAHRYAWFLTHKRIPELDILHSCDNRKCVNPSHLREGTNLENIQDKVSRNRQRKGENHPLAVLTEDKVREIRKKIQDGLTHQTIASIYGVGMTVISNIKTGKAWKHIQWGDCD